MAAGDPGDRPVGRVAVRCYAALNDFLPPARRQVTFDHAFAGRPAVKDLIEALGVPHPEVDLILADGSPVDFAHPVRDGERISVYPRFASLDVAPLALARPPDLPEARFVLDTHLGKLASYLRLLGFDTLYGTDCDDDTLARLAAGEARILLTRDRGLLKRGAVTHGYYVRATDPERQLVEVLRRFDLAGALAPFRRCLRCNGLLTPVRKEEVAERLPPKTRQYYDEFQRCQACGRIYWPGSHYRRMRRFVERVRQGASG